MTSLSKDIAHAVAKLWEKPIQLGVDALFFLDSTFGITSAGDLEAAFTDEDFSDREMVLEMLLFPDQQMRLALEPLLNRKGQSHDEMSQLCRIIFECCPVIRFTHPQWAKSINVQISREQIKLFAARLFIDQSIDPDVCQALENCRPVDEVMVCRVMIRCRQVKLNKNSRQLLIRFIEQVNESHPPFLDIFEVMITVLSEAPESSDPVSVLIAKRKQEKKQLEQIQAFEEKKDRYSMEYLMMQRYPVPLDSLENTFHRLEKLDTIINDVLGLYMPLDPIGLQRRDLGRFDPKKDMDDIIRLLS